MTDKQTSPKITGLEWGSLTLENGSTFKDAKLYPGGSRGWDWNETGTRHDPGIQPADVEELIDKGCEVIVLSQGVHGRLQVQQQTRELLEEHGIAYHLLRTPAAVERYNELRKSVAAGALIHSTC